MVVRDADWKSWLKGLRAYTSKLVGREAIGPNKSSSRITLTRVDDLLVKTGHLCQDTLPSDAVSFAWDMDEGDDVVLVPFTPSSRHLALGASHYGGHHRTCSLPAPTELVADLQLDLHGTRLSHDFAEIDAFPDPAPFVLSTNQYPDHHTSRTNSSRRLSSQDFWVTKPYGTLDSFQLLAPAPAAVNAAMEARKRANEQAAIQNYRWDQVQAEMAAREREQDSYVSAWPHPSRMEWSNSWSRPLASAAVGM